MMHYEMALNDRAERSGVQCKSSGPSTEPWGTPKGS